MRIFYFFEERKNLKHFGKKTLIFFKAKITKSDYISKTNNRTKKSFMQKMSVRSIPIYPAYLATFEGSCIFWRPKRPFWIPVATKRDMKFCAYHFFKLITHILCQDSRF